MKFHEEILVRRLCVGVPAVTKKKTGTIEPAKPSPFVGFRKPYVYGASKVSLRPLSKEQIFDEIVRDIPIP